MNRVDTIERCYQRACQMPSDINEHLPTLKWLASQCHHVTEMGTRGANGSTVAFLAAQVPRLECYDINPCPGLDALRPLAGKTKLGFTMADVLDVDIEETDLLFIDTFHVYVQLKGELERHSRCARRFIVMHDTETFGIKGEDGTRPGLWQAVEEFLAASPAFKIKQRYRNNNGLTVLERAG
jgi:hypothetical protein